MNIFVLDNDPELCAKYHCDKHCVKMILEQNQILCSVHWMTGSEAPYKLTHKNHPCSIWARLCIENYVWLLDLTKRLCEEYTRRYGKVHKCEQILNWCTDNLPNIPSNGDITPFALAMPEQYKCEDAVMSYRQYYIHEKRSFATWRNMDVPDWFLN
jgi:hypothetical protein